MKGFLWGFGLANCLWAGGAAWLQTAKVTLLMWGAPGDAAGAVIMGAMALFAIVLALMSQRARDVLTVGALLVGFGAVAAKAALAG
jgi:hypothetical protein